jgi:hypothetical protein
VVANEVKELARETATATKDITVKIAAIQAGTTAAVSAIEQISQTIQQIKDISNTIASAVDQQHATAAEIGRSLGDAAKGSSEISSGVLNVAEAAKDTAKASSSTLRSAESLAQMAAELRYLTDHFRGTQILSAVPAAGPARAESRDARAHPAGTPGPAEPGAAERGRRRHPAHRASSSPRQTSGGDARIQNAA